jgi:hypothetical protein
MEFNSRINRLVLPKESLPGSIGLHRMGVDYADGIEKVRLEFLTFSNPTGPSTTLYVAGLIIY